MDLTVLTDDQIKGLLENVTIDELDEFRNALKSALHDYSNGIQVPGDGIFEQPDRTKVCSPNTGATTLFMPSASAAGTGVKVITLSPPNDDGTKSRIRPTGAVTLFSATGRPVGILHASTLTAFRTALASSCLLLRRGSVRTVTVFGAGEQAYWHVRLALIMRGSSIRQVNIINRRFSESCKSILKRIYATPAHVKEREGWTDATFSILTPGYNEYVRLHNEQVRAADVIFCCTPSTEALFDASLLTSHEGRRKGRLIVAVGSYMPGMAELPVELLRQATKPHEGGHRHYHKHAPEGGVVVVDTLDGALKEAGEVIAAGLSPKQLVELGELVMLRRMKVDDDESPDSSSFSSSNLSMLSNEFERLDMSSSSRPSMSSVFSSETGSSSNSRPSSPSRRSSQQQLHHHRSGSHGSVDRQKRRDDHMVRWLQHGNVIYKSVGLGLMDLTVGMQLVEFAKYKGVGTHIPGF